MIQAMAITAAQAQSVTELYSFARKSGFLNTAVGRGIFSASYFLYKRYLEDAFAGLVKKYPQLFRGGNIFDVGANIGYTATLFAEAADPGAKVYAFEPEPHNFRALESLVLSRSLKHKLIPVRSAVGERTGEVSLWVNERHHADHRIASASSLPSECETVPLVSLDEFVARSGLAGTVSFVKVDVQGYEMAVCAGMKELLAQHTPPTVAIEYMPQAMAELGFDSSAMLDWFRDRAFHMYSIGKNGDLTPGFGPGLANHGYVDLLFSRSRLL